MPPKPLYKPRTEDGAYQLRYSWTGWPSDNLFARQPTELIQDTKALWEQDGLRVLEYRWTDEFVQILFSATPDVTPVLVAGRAKGRLDHAIRVAGLNLPFSRKVAVRSVGDNTRLDVEAYIERQVPKERFVDPRLAAQLAELTVVREDVDLSKPTESARGRYWYNLNLVLVVERHAHVHEIAVLRNLRDAFLKIAAKKCHVVSRLSVMPDHLHASLRGEVEQAPIDIVFAYQNNLAYMTKQESLWSKGFFVGTFGEYSTQAVRNRRAEGNEK